MEPFPVKNIELNIASRKLIFKVEATEVRKGFLPDPVYILRYFCSGRSYRKMQHNENPGQACESKAGIRKEWNFQKKKWCRRRDLNPYARKSARF